ncbi:hypothetical protein CSW57_19240 [Williamsia muralis]|uniref:Uncharacterized protein n=1 Tax=Williamsia marianensis TaxID=85044 RepID=A0A2G3PJ49_WILMA|nr:hypothetical protein CSW57_19240 [Williamsia marianensis]
MPSTPPSPPEGGVRTADNTSDGPPWRDRSTRRGGPFVFDATCDERHAETRQMQIFSKLPTWDFHECDSQRVVSLPNVRH